MTNIYNSQRPNYAGAEDGFHYITSTSPRLLDLGIAAFTTGTLFDWLHIRNNGGVRRLNYERINELIEDNIPEGETVSNYDTSFMQEYQNQKFWMHKFTPEIGALDYWPHEVLFDIQNRTAEQFCETEGSIPQEQLDQRFCFYHGWRSKGRSGEYVKVNSEGTSHENMNWEYDDGEEVYKWADLDPEYFDNRNITGWSSSENGPTGNTVLSSLTQDGKSLIHRIIEMNNYVRLLKLNKLVEDWTKTDHALNYFISDIKTSKEKYIQWLARPMFLLDIPKNIVKIDEQLNGCDGCGKYEDVYLNLYLYDTYKPKNTARKTTASSLTVAATPMTSYGWPYKSKDESGRTPASLNPDPKNAVAGEVDLSFNETTGKWEGGTTQVFGVMTESLEAADQPELESLLVDDELSLLSPENGMGVKIGKAVIMAMQNGNPLQWMPDFHYTKNCREKNEVHRKVIVDVYNITNRSFAKGENVILQKLHGVWVPQSVGSASDFITPADPKWDFTYLMTNSMFFFRNHNWALAQGFDNIRDFSFQEDGILFDGDNVNADSPVSDTKVSPNQYEQSFYRWYYKTPEKAAYDGGIEPIQITENKDRYPASVEPYARVLNGYMQVTSWDFMGIGIGGLRRKGNNVATGADSTVITESQALAEEYQGDNGVNGNALSCTQFSFNQKNEPFEGGGLNGEKNTYPFFGCVFPEGYNGSEKYAELMLEEKNFFISPKNYESYYNYQSNTPFFYAAKEPFKNLNNVRNNGVATNKHQEFGIFPEGEAGSLKHLPSDIGTNASPSGINGPPISNIAIIGEINNNIEKIEFRDVVADYFDKDDRGLKKSLSWMHKKSVDIVDNFDDPTVNYNDSAFDLQPVNPLKIEFRPLIQEVYSSFEGIYFQPDATAWQNVWEANFAGLGRGGFAKEGYQFNQAYFNPEGLGNAGLTPSLSPFSLFRNPQIIKAPVIQGNIITQDNFERFTLSALDSHLYDSPFLDDGFAYNKAGLRYNEGLSQYEWGFLTSSDMENAPFYWFQENWMDRNVPAGGVGVIGAVVSIATRDQVQFNTENAIGLDDYLEIGGAYPPSFRGGDFSTMNTTQLYARVYQNWPRDQMIYDPRFFVVHHFNPDSDIINKPIASSGSEVAARLYGESNKQVDVKESRVDFVVPTYWNNSQVPPDGANVFSDSLNEELDGKEEQDVAGVTQLRLKEHWKVSTQRRGKLLPYSYKFATIGLPEVIINSTVVSGGVNVGNTSDQVLDISQDFGFIDDVFIGMLNDREFYLSDQDILIVNRGSGYGANAKFVTEGGSGGGVVLKAIVNGSGGVLGFEVESTGFDFAAVDFVNSADEIKYIRGPGGRPSFSLLKVRIVPHPDSDAGEGFEGYVCRGSVVTSSAITDAKPMEALTTKGPIKLTPDPPLQREGNEVQSLQETDAVNNALSIDPNASTSTVSDSMYSLKNHYDVFLHFHNDISHTRMHSDNRPAELEQMVRLEILTNGSDGGSLAENAQGQNQNDSSANSDFSGNSFAAGMGSARGGLGDGGLFGGGGGFFMGGNGNFGSR